MGWSIQKGAGVVSVDLGTWKYWERGQTVLYRRRRVLIARVLGLSVEALDEEMTKRWIRSHQREP